MGGRHAFPEPVSEAIVAIFGCALRSSFLTLTAPRKCNVCPRSVANGVLHIARSPAVADWRRARTHARPPARPAPPKMRRVKIRREGARKN
ncbi:unnamed protein product, partial [Iphiclides podalirius]